jgi:phage terminase large subunit
LEYHEDSGKPLPHYIKLIKDKPYSYGKHFVPHDAAAREYGSGLSREEVARNNGINFAIVSNVKIIEGIDAVRNMLNRSWFDEEKCALGIRMLEGYKRGWDDKNGYWKDDPVHNEASHGSDAFGYLALSLQEARPGMSKHDLDKLKANAGYGQRSQPPPYNRPPPPMPNYHQGFGP